MYEIGAALPDGLVSEVDPGTNLLVSGPPLVGKREVAIELLAAGHRENDGILVITTSDDASRVIDDLGRVVAEFDREQVGVVDCSGSDDQQAIADVATQRVGSPGDLTGISIGTAKLLDYFSGQGVSGIRHGLVSVSTLLQYLELSTVFKFVHVYTNRIADTDGLGVFTIEGESHDPQTISTVTSEFDAMVELRETDDGREARVRGLGPSTGWRAFGE